MNQRIYLTLSFVLVFVPAWAVEEKYGAIEIRSTPEGASVYIEGFFSGSTPASVPDVPEGSYRVVVKSEMHGNYVEDIVVEKLKTTTVSATLPDGGYRSPVRADDDYEPVVGEEARKQIRWQFGIDGLLGLPQGEFGENLENKAAGISAFVTHRVGKTPLYLGFEISYFQYGGESRTESLSIPIPEVTLDVNTINGLLLPHFLARLQPAKGRVRPYFDALVGLNYIFTSTSVQAGDGKELASSTNFDDLTSSFGVGAGILIPLSTRDKASGERDFEFLVNVTARYLFGGRAEYLTEGSLIRQDGELFFDVLESRTDVLALHFGIAFHF